MGDGHRGVLREQQLRHRLADNVGAADHHRLQPRQRGVHGLGQHDAAERRARHQARQPAGEPAGIERMEAVHVLGRIDGGDDLVRDRSVAAAAIAPGCRSPAASALSSCDQIEQFGLARGRRQLLIERPHAGLGHRLGLVADIDFACRILADQHDRDTRHKAAVAAADGAPRRSPCRAGRPRSPCRR